MTSVSFDPSWEERYVENQQYRNLYPYDEVVSFIFIRAPRDVPRERVSILEIGCGSGNNLWFAAREGFAVAGIDGSKTAIEFARDRFEREDLTGDFRCADFRCLSFGDDQFDLVFDRGSFGLTHRQGAFDTIAEVHRTLKPGGYFQCGPFSDRDSSNYRLPDEDGAVRGIKVGTLLTDQVRFDSLQDVRELFSDGWKIETLRHIEDVDMLHPARVAHCRWLVIARKE